MGGASVWSVGERGKDMSGELCGLVGAIECVGGWAVLRVYSLPQLLSQPSPSVLFGLGLTIGIFPSIRHSMAIPTSAPFALCHRTLFLF